MVAQYIATSPIMELCLYMSRSPVFQAQNWWREQEVLVLLGSQATREEDIDGDRGGYEAGDRDIYEGKVRMEAMDRDEEGEE